MIIGFEGGMGSGKTLGATIWAWRYSLASGGLPVMANYRMHPQYWARHAALNPGFTLRVMTREDDWVDFAADGGGYVVYDEIHQNLDSRAYAGKQARYWTQFLMYLRKLRITMLLTSQSIRHQVDVRIRDNIDLLVECRKTKAGFAYDLWDPKAEKYLGRRFIPYRTASLFYGIYDTYYLVRPMRFPTTEKAYVEFLDALEDAQPRHGSRKRAPAAFWPQGWEAPAAHVDAG